MHALSKLAADLPPNDVQALERLKRFGGVKLLDRMTALYLEAAPQRIAMARAGGAAGDLESVERAFHSLKSSSAQLGAMGMQRLSELGEAQARARSLDGLSSLIDELDQELARVRAWLASASAEGAA